jgi:hypothetical protein
MRWRAFRAQFVSITVLTLPVEVEVPSGTGSASAPDSAQAPARWIVDLLGGGGTYSIIPRDCSGTAVPPRTEISFGEAAGSVELDAEHWRFGARAGWLQIEGEKDFWHVNPHVGLDWKYLGVGAGLFWSSDDIPNSDQDEAPPLSASVRLGPRSVNLRAALMEAQPLVSGGGYLQMGVGFAFRDRDSYFLGLSVEPYDGGGLVGAVDLPVAERASLLTRLRLGSTEGESEGGLALGLRWYATP